MSLTTDFPLVSVVMATYNGETFVGEQIKSILRQTYPNIELIIADDVSNDNTMAILQDFAENDHRVRVFQNETNLGYAKNFEKVMLLAKGDFIAPSDQDDIWMEDKLTVLMKQMGDHEIVYSNSFLIDSNGISLNKKLSDIKMLLSFDDCLTYAIGNTAPGHGMIVTKELLHRCIPFPTMIPHDYWLGFVATCRMPIKYVDIPLVRYRQHTQNVFGAIKVTDGKRKKKKSGRREKLEQIRKRMQLLYEKCPDNLTAQKKVYHDLLKSYQSFSLINNYNRMMLFFGHRQKILAYKKKPGFRKWLFCIKMFYKIK